MQPFIKPDFSNSILNVSATLAEFLGCPNEKPVLSDLLKELQEGYQSVVFLILDGLGMHPIEKNLPEDAFLRQNIRRVLTSVFPSTTTNATTTLLTNKSPMEHGWFGWSLYFEDLGHPVDLFLDVNSLTGEPIERGHVRKRLPIEPFYMRATAGYTTSVVVPSYWQHDGANRYVWTTFEELCGYIKRIAQTPGKQFIYAYCSEPDSVMHRFGVSSEEAHLTIGTLNRGLQALCEELPETPFVITADHGQVDIDGNIELYRDEALLSTLAWPPYLESRAPAFKVKEGRERQFRELFESRYGEDFALFESRQLIEENYFGAPAGVHARSLGDYIAVGKTHKVVKLNARSHDFKGHHTSLTAGEMNVPLIVVGSRK